MSNKTLLTKSGYQELSAQLDQLKTKQDQLITDIEGVSDSDEQGENALSVQLKEQLELVVNKIEEIEEALLNSDIIAKPGKSSSVEVGSKVKVRMSGAREKEFHIVSQLEADPVQSKISDQSPLGLALLGKKVNQEVEVSAPAGVLRYKIVAIG